MAISIERTFHFFKNITRGFYQLVDPTSWVSHPFLKHVDIKIYFAFKNDYIDVDNFKILNKTV